VRGANKTHANLPARRLHRQHSLGKSAIETQVNVHHEIGPVDVKKVLAMRFGPLQHQSIQDSGGCRESALRAGYFHWRPAVIPLVALGQPVCRMAFRHR
jgi:hypothetical protein